MKLNERTVHHYDLVMSSSTRSKGIVNPSKCTLEALITGFTKLGANGTEISKTAGASVEISDWNFNAATKILTVLLNRADREVSDVAFKDLTSKVRRRAGKTKQEGIETSCHLLVKPNTDGHSALVLMTMGSGITFQTVERVLTTLAKLAKAVKANHDLFNFALPSGEADAAGKPVTYAVRYSFHLLAHKGSILDDALKGGSFVSMELIAHKHSPFDAGGNLQFQKQSFFVVAANAKSVSGALVKSALKKYLNADPEYQFDSARIAYTDTDGRTKATTLETNNLDAAFTKRDVISLASPVESQQDQISATIRDEMLKLI